MSLRRCDGKGNEMARSTTEMATQASFQALANCYLREVDGGNWQRAISWQRSAGVVLSSGESDVIELDIPMQEATLAIGVAYRSLVGRHTLTDVYRRSATSTRWQRIDPFSAEVLLIDAVYASQPTSRRRLELFARLVESHQVMAAYLDSWLERGVAGKPKSFIESEQSVIWGHWLHPTPKSRQGIHAWQHAQYAPELGGRFQLHFVGASRELVLQASVVERSAEEISREFAFRGLDEARAQKLQELLGFDKCALPLHPLQAHFLFHQDYVQRLLASGHLVDLGRLGPTFTPTSSVRTLYAEDEEFMVKLSIPVKITNSLRWNLQSELGDSIGVTELLRKCETFEQEGDLRPIEDPAYISLGLPDREETGFEVILRKNPFLTQAGRLEQEVHSIAALVQDALPGRSRSRLAELVEQLAAHERISLARASREWFEDYFRCAIESVIRAYDAHGIGLEAHQQNVLLALQPSGRPCACYYRDIQGLALAESSREQTLQLAPELAAQPKVFEPDELVRNGLGYYLIFNQLYAVVNRFGLDRLIAEESSLHIARERLLLLRRSMRGPGASFIDVFLRSGRVSCKANLLTRIADVDELQAENELGVYCLVENPLASEFVAASSSKVSGSGYREELSP